MRLRESPQRTRLAASGLLLLTFAAGCLMGAASSRVMTSRTASAAPAESNRTATGNTKGNHRTRGFVMDPQLLDEIGASAEQRAAINVILEMREQEATLMWQEWETHFDSAMNQTRGQIRAQLSEEQVRKLREAVAARRARRKQAQDSAQTRKTDRDHAHENRELLFF